jgi:hypothetical protein
MPRGGRNNPGISIMMIIMAVVVIMANVIKMKGIINIIPSRIRSIRGSHCPAG